MSTIRDIREKIVEKLRRGEPIGTLEDDLAQAHALAAAQEEITHLREIAAKRTEMFRRASVLQERVRVHEAHIEDFLQRRDSILPILQEAVKLSAPLVEAESRLYNGEGFSNPSQFMAVAGDIPSGYLPPELKCNFLEQSASGQEAVAHLHAALSILATIRKAPVEMAPSRPLLEDL
jgi:hypothetical protein